jgi:hypothetical protein
MKSHRIIIYIGVLLAVAVALPGSALASPLLSGYGGPGQGNQALLGSALVNGPKGGGGSSGSTTSTDTGIAESESSSEGQVSGAGSGSSKGGGTGSSSRSSSAGRSSSHAGAGKAAPGRSPTQAAAPSFYPAAERLPADSQGGSLGLSATDVLLIVLAAALLVSLGLLTRRAGGSGGRQSTGG